MCYKRGMKWIFLSPHLDDIVFSCGGMVWDLAKAGHNIEVWTICAGDPPQGDLSPFAQELHKNWDLGLNAVQIRREEDQKACQIIGATPRYFSYQDCIYRKTSLGEFFYPTEKHIFGGLDPREAGLIERLSDQLRGELPEETRVVAPLGIGNHVDHELTRKAVNRLDIPVAFYADYPYARDDQGIEILDFMEASTEWQSEEFPTSEEGLGNWVQAARAYGSQISTFWNDDEHLGIQISEFSTFLGGFKLWRAVENH